MGSLSRAFRPSARTDDTGDPLRLAQAEAVPFHRWQKQWAAETWDISTEGDEEYQGGHDWISDTTIWNWHIAIPPLPNSRIIFADATGISGGIHTERVGTTSWQY